MLTITLLLASLVVSGRVGPIPGSEPVRPAFEKADLVCFGEITDADVVKSNDKSGGSVKSSDHYQLKLHEIFKETESFPPTITLELPHDPGASGTSLQRGQSALFFLSKEPNSLFVLSNAFIGVTMFTSLSGGSALEGLPKLETALATEARSGTSITDRVNALQLLEGFDTLSSATMTIVAGLSSETSPEIALTSIAIQLKNNEPDSVSQLRRFLSAYNVESAPTAILNCGTALGRITDPGALRDIEVLSGSRYLSIQLGAMDALRAIKNQDSAPTLVARLDDSNEMIRYLAVMSLGEIFSSDDAYHPSLKDFRQDQQKFVSHWKEWWAARHSPES